MVNDELNFKKINSQSDYLYLENTESAIDSLETACYFIDKHGNMKWKWISISIHHSLYSFCISYLHKGNKDKISYIEKNSGKRKLISFKKAINKTIDTPYYVYVNGPPKEFFIKITKKEKEKIEWLNDEIRNNFIHFIPKVDSIPINEIKSVCSIALDLIEEIAVKSYSLVYLDFQCSQNRIQTALVTLRKNLLI